MIRKLTLWADGLWSPSVFAPTMVTDQRLTTKGDVMVLLDGRARLGPARCCRAVMVALAVAVAGCGGGDANTSTSPATSSATATSATSATSVPAQSSTPVVVDTDLAIDDLVALALLLSSDDIDVLAVTVSGTGEVRCPAGIDVVQELLVRTGDEGVPVACGRSTPLVGNHEFPVEWRDAADSGWGVLVPSDADGPEPDSSSAPELLGETLQSGVTLLTLGPLTNVAEALRADPDVAERVESVVVMGGAMDVSGNIVDPALDAAHSEWNIYVDPIAASEVFGSGAPVLLVALDATNQVPITPLFLERLALNNHTAYSSLVATLYGANPLVGSGDAYFWDPLAAAAIIDSGVLTTETAGIAVVTDEGPESGRTIRSETGFAVDVATDADAAMLEELLLRTLDGVSPEEDLVEPSPPVAEAAVTYDGTTCSYDGPTTVPAGRMGFRFDSEDSTWVAAVAYLTGDLTLEEIVSWVEANPDAQEPPPGVGEVAVAPPGTVTYVNVRAPGAAVVCAPFEPGPLLVAGSIVVE